MIEIEICKKIYDKAKETFLSKLEDEIKERKEEHIKQEKLEESDTAISSGGEPAGPVRRTRWGWGATRMVLATVLVDCRGRKE